MYDLFLDLEVSFTTNDRLQQREKLISAVFIAAINLNEFSIASHIAMTFESNMLQTVDTVVPVVIEKIRKSKF